MGPADKKSLGILPGGFTTLATNPQWASDNPLLGGRTAAGGDKLGYLNRGGVTGVELIEPNQTTALPPRLAAPITGARSPNYQTSGGVPLFSNQARARMTPGDRTVLGVTVNRAGGNETDYFEEAGKLTGGARGRGISYGGVPRYARR